MRDVHTWRRAQASMHSFHRTKDLSRAANEICEKALHDAKAKLHPLLSSADLNCLGHRKEFVQSFQFALETISARKIALWQPSIQSIFRFDESYAMHNAAWDGKIHLLVKVPRLSNAVKAFGRSLDQYLLMCLKHFGWSRFQTQQSILDLQQVTVNELRHGVSYGAMFSAVHSVPVQVWPQKR